MCNENVFVDKGTFPKDIYHLFLACPYIFSVDLRERETGKANKRGIKR